MERSDSFLHIMIRNCDTLVLAEMLEPGLDHKLLQVPPRIGCVGEETPLRRAVTAPDTMHLSHHAHELLCFGGINPVFDCDECGSPIGIQF
jgi:hypothetical protein